VALLLLPPRQPRPLGAQAAAHPWQQQPVRRFRRRRRQPRAPATSSGSSSGCGFGFARRPRRG